MKLKLLQKRCEALIQELGVPVPCEAHAFCQALAARRGRPIVVRPIALPPGVSGLWYATPTTDFILYERATSGWHQQMIILHEAGHIAWEHQPAHTSPVEFPMSGDLPADTADSALHRAGYSRQEEQEAETFATVVLQHSSGTAVSSATAPDPVTADLIKRLALSLETSGEEGAP
jgi:hypothetical protein